jgi:hypothetical protein
MGAVSLRRAASDPEQWYWLRYVIDVIQVKRNDDDSRLGERRRATRRNQWRISAGNVSSF